jgi:hypothetical protein
MKGSMLPMAWNLMWCVFARVLLMYAHEREQEGGKEGDYIQGLGF